MKRRTPLRLVVPAAAFALVSSACASEEAPLDWLRPAGPIAEDIGGLWTLVFWVAVGVFFLVEGAILYAMVRFRERKGDTEPPVQTHGNTPLEIGWTIAPALILAVLAVPTLSGIWALSREQPDSLHMTVTGHQWWWQYSFEGEEWTSANELHIPVGQPVRIALESADVIHSFWVPRLAGKQDVVPGRTNHLTIEASEAGEFQGTCVEFCGLSHANMRFRVFAHEPQDFQRWLSEQRREAAEPSSDLARRGQRLFLTTAQCATCHTVRGAELTVDGQTYTAAGVTGPDLTHIASRDRFAGSIFELNEENLTRWVSNAPDEKPGSLMPAGLTTLGLTPEDVEALVAYLLSLE